MDILKPALVQIGNRCYRKNPIFSDPFGMGREDEGEHVMRAIEGFVECTLQLNGPSWTIELQCTFYEILFQKDEDVRNDYTCEEVCTAGLDIISSSNGYSLAFSLPSALYGYIIGKKGETKKRVETETRTKIAFPRANANGDILIQGSDRSGVTSAHSRLCLLAETARKSHPFTHFLSLPMCSEMMRASLEEFKKEILQSCQPGENIDETIFQNPAKLHITIGTLTLLDTSEVMAASKVLEEAQRIVIDDILGGRSLDVEVQGLEIMNDDSDQVDVLYAQVNMADGSNTLQKLADRLIDLFVSERLMSKQYDHVKLHVTVINSLMRRSPDGSSEAEISQPSNQRGRNDRARESFKASRILKDFGEYSFGRHTVPAIHLSQKQFTGSDGYYAPAASLELPRPTLI